MEPNDPLVIVNCARILISLPDMVPDINYGKQLLLKGLHMAPHDLAVLKAIIRVVIVCKNKVIYNISLNIIYVIAMFIVLICYYYLCSSNVTILPQDQLKINHRLPIHNYNLENI